MPHTPNADRGRGNRRDLRLLQRRAIREFLPEGVRFLRRSEELDRDTTLGREIYDSFTAEVEADLYVLAHATSPFIRAETVADALGK